MNITSILLNAAVTNVSSADFFCPNANFVRFYVKSAAVTTGATVTLEAKSPAGDYHILSTGVVATNTVTTTAFQGPVNHVRATISARTDGTFTVSVQCSDGITA